MAETRAPSAASITVECELAYDQEVGVDVERGAVKSAGFVTASVIAANVVAEYPEIDGLADDVGGVFLIVVFMDANEYY
jgi:hypothetical protein